MKLRVGVSSVGRPPIPDRRVRQAVHYTFTAGVKLPYSVGCLHVTERVRLPPVIQGAAILLALICFHTAFEKAGARRCA